jgi:glycerol uptake facilitator-like aquaporin
MEHFCRCYSYYNLKVFGKVNEHWAAAIKFVRAREFFAEFLGTFMLLVSYMQCS